MRKIMLLWITLFISCASAEEQLPILFFGGNSALIFNVETVKLTVNDEVIDGCLPNPSSVRNTAEAALRRNNISVVDEGSYFDAEVEIAPNGYSIGQNACAVNFSMSIKQILPVTIPHSEKLDNINETLTHVNWQIYSALLTGSKADMQRRIEREAEKGSNELFIAIDRAKDSIKDKWPQLWKATQEK